MQPVSGRKTLQSVDQLSAGHHGHAYMGGLDCRKPCFYLRGTAFDRVAGDVRIEHVKHAYCSSEKRSRSRGGKFIGRSAMNSSGTLMERIVRKKSRHTLEPGRSDKTTSPVTSSRVA